MPVLPDRIRLVVLFGGRSAEHDVSCVSAASVLGAIDRDRYDVTPIGITRDGRWVLAEEAMAALAEGVQALPPSLRPSGPEVDPLPAVRPAAAGDAPVVVFPILHGPLGEDGTVQGMLELAGVPYVGGGVLGSAAAMDKVVAKALLSTAGIPQARGMARRDGLVEDGFLGKVAAELGFPVFVKPANMGSSVGVSKATDEASLAEALELALRYDEWVLVEEGVTAREVECAVLGSLTPAATPLGEIIPKADWYDYEDKYSGDGAELVIPADLPEEVHERAARLAVDAFVALRCEGLARVDFFYEEGGRGLLVNEVNTMPGFTPFSMYPQLWAAAGIGYPELIDRLVALALERHGRQAARAGRQR